MVDSVTQSMRSLTEQSATELPESLKADRTGTDICNLIAVRVIYGIANIKMHYS